MWQWRGLVPGRKRAGPATHRVLALVVLTSFSGNSLAKQPGAVHCYRDWCHRVSTVEEMQSIVGRRGLLKASYYDNCRVDRLNACGLTSSGEMFNADAADNAASPIFPDGSVLLVFNPMNGRAAVVRVNSAGPYHADRKLDVSRATAEALAFKERGVAELVVAVLKSPEADEARYKKLRHYPKVPGYLGQFNSFEAAHDEAVRQMRLEFLAVSEAAVFRDLPISSVDKDEAAIPVVVAGSAAGASETRANEIESPVVASRFCERCAENEMATAILADRHGSRFLNRVVGFLRAARISAKPLARHESAVPSSLGELSYRLLRFAEAARNAAGRMKARAAVRAQFAEESSP